MLDTAVKNTTSVVDEIQIHVNDKPVDVIGRRQTGLEIKQAAKAQGVAIELDFVLSIERGPSKSRIIGDNEVVTVTKNSRFLAIPDDDNS